jgi:hypothetical protein
MRESRFLPSALALLILASAPAAKVILSIPGYRQTYPAGMIGGGTPVPKAYVAIPPAGEYFLDYRVFFESDWEWVKGGKLPGLVGGTHTSGCAPIDANGWSARFMWRREGVGQMYLYHQDRINDCGDEWDFPAPGAFVKEGWNRITERVVINTPGKNDGIVEAWLNGVRKISLKDLRLRGNVAATVALIDNVSLQTFYGGSDDTWAPTHDTHSRFSSFFVRDDLPDFTLGFEEANQTGIRAAPAQGTAASAAGGTVLLTWLGGAIPPGIAKDLPPGWLHLFDARGRPLRSLETARGYPDWDGSDSRGRAVPPGILLIRFEKTGR